uniref:Uncharacterized protein n=1 Tax=Micrurus corallinus TaxID=54390 RepID=A0A2D4F4Q8_MICCO
MPVHRTAPFPPIQTTGGHPTGLAAAVETLFPRPLFRWGLPRGGFSIALPSPRRRQRLRIRPCALDNFPVRFCGHASSRHRGLASLRAQCRARFFGSKGHPAGRWSSVAYEGLSCFPPRPVDNQKRPEALQLRFPAASCWVTPPPHAGSRAGLRFGSLVSKKESSELLVWIVCLWGLSSSKSPFAFLFNFPRSGSLLTLVPPPRFLIGSLTSRWLPPNAEGQLVPSSSGQYSSEVGGAYVAPRCPSSSALV